MSQTLALSPLAPLALVALVGGVLVLAAAWRRALRARALLGLVLAFVGVGLLWEKRTETPLPDTVVVVADHSRSNTLAGRAERTAATEKALAAALADHPDLTPIWVSATDTAATGSNLLAQARRTLDTLPPDSLSALVLLTDGDVTDLSPADTLGVPVHVLDTGGPARRDRRLVLERAPAYALVGAPQTVGLTIVDPAADGEVPVTLRVGGLDEGTFSLPANKRLSLQFTLSAAGPTAIELTTPPIENELTTANNTAIALVSGVRENLNVLLVSGQPHNGAKALRALLKSDPSVNLVHFTILRTLGKMDFAAEQDLSLIPFPVRELFTERLPDFDLIVFDEYVQRGLINGIYFDHIRDYVTDGGALFVIASPDMATDDGLANTAIGDVLPVRPRQMVRQVFRPTVSDVGQRHPVTAPLAERAATWGRFGEYMDARLRTGDVLLKGPDGAPLLVVDRVGKGRVATFLSGHLWFWGRGVDGGGPDVELFRRVAHWLMREPALDENRLTARHDNGVLTVVQTRLHGTEATRVQLEGPRGVSETFALPAAKAVSFTAPDEGLYTLRAEDGRLAYAINGSVRDLEWQAETNLPLLDKLVADSGGGRHDVGDGTDLPTLRRTLPGQGTAGPGWIGLPRNDRALLTDLRTEPLLPPGLALFLVLAALALTWWHEARRR